MGPFVLVVGARPNFVKIAPILRALQTRTDAPRCELVHTGQHYDAVMSGVFFGQLGIREPDVHLQIGSASHGVQTGKIMVAFDEYLAAQSATPSAIVVVGDVNSTMACALVGAKRELPVVHVEAGLRSFDRAMPEEINRIVTDSVSARLLVSEPAGLKNLANEGIEPARVRYVGNVMIDTLVHELAAARALEMPVRFGQSRSKYALVTLHRPSNVDDPQRLALVVEFLTSLAARIPVVFPVHPRTAVQLDRHGLRSRLNAHVVLTDPLAYREFIGLIEGAAVVVSDSGGIQEEATFLGVPCITLRSNTERPVTVSQGTNVLAGNDLTAALGLVDDALRGSWKAGSSIDGWDGKAAERVADVLLGLAAETG